MVSNVSFKGISNILNIYGSSENKKNRAYVANSPIKPEPITPEQLREALKSKYALNISQAYSKPINETPISQIRMPILGEVRDEHQLKTRDIKKLIDFQMKKTSSRSVKEIIESYPEQDRKLVTNLMLKLTQYGNMDTFDSLVLNVKSKFVDNYIYNDDYPSVGAIFNYLSKNKAAMENKIFYSKNNGVLLLDEITLNRLEKDEKFRKSIINNSEILIGIMEGWTTGFNPYNQASKDLSKTVKSKYIELKELLKKNPELDETSAIKEILNKPVLDKLSKLGITNTSKILVNEYAYLENHANPIDVVISRQLNHTTMTRYDIDKVLSRFKPELVPYIKELLAQEIDVNSPKSIGIKLQNIHKKIKKLVQNEEGLYYYIPKNCKSYSTILSQYMISNNKLDVKVLVGSNIKELPKDAKNLVILDDIAGTGNSFAEAYDNLRPLVKEKTNVIFAPIIASEYSRSKINTMPNAFGKINFITTEHFTNFINKKYYNSLSLVQKRMFEKILGERGYQSQMCNIAFPYMSPDNNNMLFSTYFAPKFTFNSKGVKNFDYDNMLRHLLKSM